MTSRSPKPTHDFIEGGGRQPNIQINLDFRLHTGERWSFPYSYLISTRFDSSGTIFLTFSSHQVEIQGRNLTDLYEKLLVQVIAHVLETDPKHEELSESQPFIEKIIVKVVEE